MKKEADSYLSFLLWLWYENKIFPGKTFCQLYIQTGKKGNGNCGAGPAIHFRPAFKNGR